MDERELTEFHKRVIRAVRAEILVLARPGNNLSEEELRVALMRLRDGQRAVNTKGKHDVGSRFTPNFEPAISIACASLEKFHRGRVGSRPGRLL